MYSADPMVVNSGVTASRYQAHNTQHTNMKIEVLQNYTNIRNTRQKNVQWVANNVHKNMATATTYSKPVKGASLRTFPHDTLTLNVAVLPLTEYFMLRVKSLTAP